MRRPTSSSRSRSRSTSERGAAARAALVVALCAATASCGAWNPLVHDDAPEPPAKPAAAAAPSPAPAPPRPAFSHAAHLAKGPECLDCHEGADKADKAGMPNLEFCMDCHSEIDEPKPKERRVEAFLGKDGKPVWSRVTAQPADVLFSHGRHAAKAVECASCHEGIAESTKVTADLRLSMDDCTTCHTQRRAPNECATCHRQGNAWKPANHDRLWLGLHGDVSRRDAPATHAEDCTLCHTKQSCAECHAKTQPRDHRAGWTFRHGLAARADHGRCENCHTQQSCQSCHAVEAPRDHSETWRVGPGHGLAAAIDRTRCDACHRVDSCDACHRAVSPRSHTAAWGAPRSRHCVSCHEPLRPGAGGCSTCHDAAPGHTASPRQPSWHRPDFQCQLCHDKLRHAWNGQDCRTCHR